MRKISTDFIEPGCIAAADIVSPSGNTLVNKGAPITPALGRRLRNWGISEISVEGEDDSETSVKAETPSPVKIKSDLYDKFLGTLDNTRMRKIFDAVCKHKIQKQESVA
ncbi:MAG: hypothetical protein FWC23_04690 [Chitinispirillia bacterium]|nr:hypothetical protein [Chitinispirillia bacterium]MCL2268465.1 hypothetical protein [Chitinispirillia bacterium]